MSNRRTRVLLVTAAGATVVVAGIIAVFAALSPAGHPSGNPAAPGDGAGGAASAPPGMVAASAVPSTIPSVTASVAGPPVPGTSGDRYAHGVTAGATCAPVGALGFTAQLKVLQCSSTAADPHPRWRAP